jgi:hypothetical protein
MQELLFHSEAIHVHQQSMSMRSYLSTLKGDEMMRGSRWNAPVVIRVLAPYS